jgi:hypothetical protein
VEPNKGYETVILKKVKAQDTKYGKWKNADIEKGDTERVKKSESVVGRYSVVAEFARVSPQQTYYF